MTGKPTHWMGVIASSNPVASVVVFPHVGD